MTPCLETKSSKTKLQCLIADASLVLSGPLFSPCSAPLKDGYHFSILIGALLILFATRPFCSSYLSVQKKGITKKWWPLSAHFWYIIFIFLDLKVSNFFVFLREAIVIQNQLFCEWKDKNMWGFSKTIYVKVNDFCKISFLVLSLVSLVF